MFIDLQLHSTYSDGKLTPTGLAAFLSKNGVKTAALTDHNTVAGLDEFASACKQYKIKPINGIEIYASHGSRKVNLLFYNFDKDNPTFHQFLRHTQIQRCKNVARALRYWQNHGFNVDTEEIFSHYNHYIPANGLVWHLWDRNREKIKEQLRNNDPHEWEIMKYYFKNRKKCYLSETYVNIQRFNKIRQKIGGQVVIAHPFKNRIKSETILKLLDEKVIDGVEILSPHHNWDGICYLLHILKDRKKTILTGGSDFHGYNSTDYNIKASWDYYKIDSSLLHHFEEITGQNICPPTKK